MSITKSFYTLIASLGAVQSAFANSTSAGETKFGLDKINTFKTSQGAATPGEAIGNVIIGLLTIVSVVAVGYMIYAGSQIMTAGGDEEKVKTARKTIINVFVGIVVMWLAYWIVSLVFKAIV